VAETNTSKHSICEEFRNTSVKDDPLQQFRAVCCG